MQDSDLEDAVRSKEGPTSPQAPGKGEEIEEAVSWGTGIFGKARRGRNV